MPRTERKGNTTTVYDDDGTVLQKWRDNGRGKSTTPTPKAEWTRHAALCQYGHRLNSSMAYDNEVTVKLVTGHVLRGRVVRKEGGPKLPKGSVSTMQYCLAGDQWFGLNAVESVT
jgi:hypothetical protein